MTNQIKVPKQDTKTPSVEHTPISLGDNVNNNLSSLIGEEPVDLMSLVVDDKGDRRATFPDNAIKNRAAYAALLSGSPKLTEVYQSIVAENQAGEDYTRPSIMNKILPQVDTEAKHGVMTILADPRFSDQQKIAAIKSVNDGFVKDSATILANAAFAAPVKGETPEAEDVRIMGADQFRGIQEHNAYIQGIKNRHEAMRGQNGQVRFFDEFVETLLPFATNVNAARNLTQLSDALKLNYSGGKAFALPGSIAKDISDTLKAMPVEQRTKVSEKLYNIIENNKGIFFQRDNLFNETEQVKKLLGGDYSNFDKWMDNTVGLLDIIGLGLPGIVKNGVKRLTSLVARTPEKVEQKAVQRGVVNTTSPVAPMSVLREANPEKAKATLKTIVESESDEVAQALTGTNRTDAIASEVLPQPKTVDGTVESKIIKPDEEILKAAEMDGGYRYTANERKAAASNILHDMDNLAGLSVLDNMASVGLKGDKTVISAMFGNSQGGFKNAEEAFNQAKFALREYGIVDKDIQLFKKIEGEYVPISMDEAKLAEGNYTVGVDFDYKFTTEDIGKMDALDVKRNLLDYIPILRSNKSGTAANHLMTHASMLHPTITGSASVAVDNAVKIDKLFLEMHEKFSKPFSGLAKERQAKIYEHLKEANQYGLELSDPQLLAKGFHQDEISLVHQWRKNWDTHFYFENADVVRTLQNQGYKVFEDASKGNKFYAKPIAKNGNIEHLYDPAIDQVRTVHRLEMDQLYESGGHFAQLRRPVTINGVEVEHMIVRNNPNEYLRALNPGDQILNYKKGYFQVGYKAPIFIEEIVRTAGGKEKYRKAVHMAANTEEAEQIRKRLATSQGKSIDDYNIRNDIKDFRPETDYYWDLQHASGRVAQRHRGKLLEDSTSHANGFDGRFTLDPVESAIRASRSLSGRIAMRDLLETHKARAIEQYEEFFPKVEGQTKWVENSNSLVNPGNMVRKDIAEARTTVEFINYLQRGYENALDSSVAGLWNMMGQLMHKIGFSKGEEFAFWAQKGKPVELLKNGVFQAYIATNPLRQFLVQSHQAVRLLGYSPTGLINAVMQGGEYFRYASGMADLSKASKETREMVEFVKASGMLDAVDKHNLVRGSLTELAESPSLGKKIVGNAFAIPRKMGFDIGEQTNLLMHLLTVRDKYIKAGKDIKDPFIRDEIYSVARAISYDMNRAGDMPYNSNWAGLFLQFMQVPHKAISAVTTNRRIPVMDRMKMAGVDMLLFGIPGATFISNYVGKDMLPQDPDERESVLFGLTSMLYNAAFTKLAGSDTKADFSTLSPYNTDGFNKLFEAIVTGGMEEFFMNSPSATFYFKENSRMREAIGRLFRYTGYYETEEGVDPEDMVSVMKGVAELSSGWTNAMKARMILETGKLYDKQGVPLAQNLTAMHAFAQAFGLPPLSLRLQYEALKEPAAGTKDHKEEVDKWYKSYVRLLARDQKLTTDDPEYQVKVLGAAKLLYKKDPEALRIIQGNLKRDMPAMRDKIIPNAIKFANIPDNEGHSAALENLRMLKDKDYDNMLKLRQDIIEQTKKINGED